MISDAHIELLAAYLDDALSPEEVERVVSRLSSDSEFADTLSRLRVERASRLAAWESLAPTEDAAQQFASRVIRNLRRDRLLESVRHWSRLAGTVAASVAVGLMVGWFAWGRAPHPNSLADSGTGTRTAMHIPGEGPDGAGTYQVALTDDRGNVLAVEHFSARDEAERFAHDLGQVQERRQDIQDGHATLISDRF